MQEENHHTLLIKQHDPLLYGDARETVEHISRAIEEAANNAIVLRYSLAVDPFLEEMMNHADRIFYFEQEPRPAAKTSRKDCRKAKARTTSEAL